MIQILQTTLDCSNESMLKIIYLIKKIIDLVGIFVPIILIIWCMWDALRNMISQNGWDQKIIKKMINRFIAAVCVFIIPTILNFVLNVLGENGYEVGTCWKEATKSGINNAEKKDIKNSDEIKKTAKSIINKRKKLTKKWGKK